jgi:hypothetical protein
MLKIHEFSAPTGELRAVHLRVEADALEIVAAGEAWPLSAAALAAVFARYGAPFDAEARIVEVARLELASGETVRHVRHLAGYDVIARDYLVHHRPQSRPSCVLAATATAALLHLGRASGRRISGE